jgi:Ca2+-binding EF-hand superfamily protein
MNEHECDHSCLNCDNSALTVRSGQGTVATRDLPTLLRALGKNPSQDELKALLTEVCGAVF